MFSEGDFANDSVYTFFAHTTNNRKEYNFNYHNLGLVILVGYSVNKKNNKNSILWKKVYIENLEKLEEL